MWDTLKLYAILYRDTGREFCLVKQFIIIKVFEIVSRNQKIEMICKTVRSTKVWALQTNKETDTKLRLPIYASSLKSKIIQTFYS